MGFYSLGNWGSAKKVLLNPLKSFHDWKHKFFFIREEVILIAMIFHAPDTIEKEELPIPKGEAWYLKLAATPNQIFGENVLAHLYQAAFPTFGGSMGVRPLEAGEQYWCERIKGHFLYPPAGDFANPPTTTKGSSYGELSSWSNIFAGMLRDLGIDLKEKKKKPNKKKKKKVIVKT
ncbi:hypothetical protein Hanom_Chr02g00104721 [Helianthus anomalus]